MSAATQPAGSTRYQWAAPGDVNAFFGLMLDNIADLVLTVSLLAIAFGFPAEFAFRHMIPGTAIGVLVGDLLFFWMAISLAKRTGRNDITAMPLGLDTPSTIGMVIFVLGPAFLAAKQNTPDVMLAARHAWHIGICSIFISGLFKFACAFGSGWIRRLVPRAGLLGSLTAIALVLISFLPLLHILDQPIVGLISLAIVLTALVAKVQLPFRIPGAFGALLVGGTVYYLMRGMGFLDASAQEAIDPSQALMPYEWLTVFRFEWLAAMDDTVKYLPIVIPFALGTVIGGIDCTESAAAAGDEFDTGRVIGVEAFATLVASLCGGVIQTTPYIGHPAYKAMGGRAAYTLATALFIGSAGLFGFFAYLYILIPQATVYPILMFIGLEITAQSFAATPKRHYAAVAFAIVPALAALAMIFVDGIFGDPAIREAGIDIGSLNVETQKQLETLRVLSNGFIVTSLLWASSLAAIIDRRLWIAAIYFLLTAICTCFGVIHSPLPGGAVFAPWNLAGSDLVVVINYASGYAAVSLLLLLWGAWCKVTQDLPSSASSMTTERDWS